MAAIKLEKTLIELAQDFNIHPNQIKRWRDQLLEGATGVFGAQFQMISTQYGQVSEVRELRQANEILRKASAYFAQAELVL